MRKLLVILATVLLFAIPVLAEEINVEEMDLASLLKLHEQIDALIQEKLDCELDANNMYEGKYVVGKDIKAGNYLLTKVSETHFMCHLYADEEHYQTHDGQHETIVGIGETLSLTLEDEMVLIVDQGVASVKMIEKPSWAP